jgi:hypothetical protein
MKYWIEKQIEKKEKKEKNIGILILKIYLSFNVVNTHCLDTTNIQSHFIFFLSNNLHAPTFFIISFFLFYKSLISRNINKFKQRFQRLLIPYIAWPIIIFIANNIFFFILKAKFYKSFKDLKNQLLTGHSFIPSLWFQWDLIFETFLFIIIELLFHKYIIIILINIEITSYFLQYSNYNYYLFQNLIYEQRFTFGRLMEILPYSISGLIIAHSQLMSTLKKNRIKTLCFCFSTFYFFYKYNLIAEPLGFYYQGLRIHIQSICLFITFTIISFDCLPFILTKTIKHISALTPGVYYLHIPLRDLFEIIFISVQKKNFFGSLFIYIISYCICFIGNRFLINTKLRNLFQ